jgi:hypothetical protein
MRQPTRTSLALTRFRSAIERRAARLHSAADQRAHRCGWEIMVTGRFGGGRVYRDPRFARFVACGWCSGSGCPRCDGTGRVVRGGTAAGRGGSGSLR